MSCGLPAGLPAGPGSLCGWPAACPLLQPSSPHSGRLRPRSAAQDPPNGVLLGAVTPTGSAFAPTSGGPSSRGSSSSPAEEPGGFSMHFPALAEGRPDCSGCELAIFLHDAASVARMCGGWGQLVGQAPHPHPQGPCVAVRGDAPSPSGRRSVSSEDKHEDESSRDSVDRRRCIRSQTRCSSVSANNKRPLRSHAPGAARSRVPPHSGPPGASEPSEVGSWPTVQKRL